MESDKSPSTKERCQDLHFNNNHSNLDTDKWCQVHTIITALYTLTQKRVVMAKTTIITTKTSHLKELWSHKTKSHPRCLGFRHKKKECKDVKTTIATAETLTLKKRVEAYIKSYPKCLDIKNKWECVNAKTTISTSETFISDRLCLS